MAGAGILVAALPGELGPLTRGWRRVRGPRVEVRREPSGAAYAAWAGMGPVAADRAWTAASAEGEPRWAASLGWAGALDPELEPGRAFWVSEVVDARDGTRYPACAPPGAGRGLVLVSAAGVAAPREKARLRRDHGAHLVDLEAATVARLARERGLPFACLKGVSDGPETALPDLGPHLDPDGSFHAAAFAARAALAPWAWPGLLRLARDSREAARGMARLLGPKLADPAFPAPRS